jgi:hypothetical protein
MKTIFLSGQAYILKTLFLFSIVLFAGTGYGQSIGDYRSVASGNWALSTTWQTWNGSAWVAATVLPPSNALVTILNTHNVTISVSTTIPKTVVNYGGTLTVGVGRTLNFGSAVTGDKLVVSGILHNQGTINFSGSTTIASGGVFRSIDILSFLTGSLLSIDGTFINSSGTVSNATANSIHFNAGSVYEHNFTSTRGFIPSATWNTGSVCRIAAYTSPTGAPQNINQSFYNFEWNTPNLTSNISLSLNTINGSLSINNTGTATLSLESVSKVGLDLLTSSASHVELATDLRVGGNVIFSTGSVIALENLSLSLAEAFTDQTIDVKGWTVNNLLIDNPLHTVTINSTIKIKGSLSILSEGTTLATNGYLQLLSTKDEGYLGDASVGVLPTGSTITGNVMVEHYMSNEGNIYRYLSAPVSGFSVSGLQNDLPVTGSFAGKSPCVGCAPRPASLFYYAAATSQNIQFPKAPQTNAATFEVGRGYLAFVNQNILPGPVTIHWSGVINQGTLNLPVDFDSSMPSSSWNLVGNPYPATVDWNKGQVDGTGWTSTNIAQSIAVKDNGAGCFHYYPDDGGNETFNYGQIAKGQSFWVRAIGANPTLQIREDAKAGVIGAFYRQATPPQPTNRIIVSLSNTTSSDRAYYKIIDDADSKMDYYDAPKMVNDGASALNISTLIPKGNVAMAINAVNSLACNDTIKLKMSGASGQALSVGNYTLSLSASGVMNDFNWILTDTYLKSAIEVSDSISYSFMVTSVSASRAANRFQLIAAKKQADLSVAVTGITQVCGDAGSVIKISNSQPHVTYALEINGKNVSEPLTGNTATLSFTVAAGVLTTGNNEVSVTASTGCNQDYLSHTLVIEKAAYYIPGIETSPVCRQGSVTLTAADLPTGGDVRWYSSKATSVVLATGATYKTPELSTTTTYYAAGVNAFGCEGERVAVRATIISLDKAFITTANDSILQSNFSEGNQWFLNGEIIEGATGQRLQPKTDGLYTVHVTREGCTSEAIYEFKTLAPGAEQTPKKYLVAYPNPVADQPLHIEVLDGVTSVSLLNSQGIELKNQVAFVPGTHGIKTTELELAQYQPGIYFLQVKNGNKVTTLKIAKK